MCRSCKCSADGGRSFQLCVGQLASAAAARVQREQHAYDQVASRVGMESRASALLKSPLFRVLAELVGVTISRSA